MNAVVVGVDGSDESLHAVRWAAAEAAWRGVALRIVTAVGRRHVRDSQAAAESGGGPPGPHQTLRTAAQAAREVSARLDVHEEALGDGPVRALLGAAEGAPVLALGSRALGPVAGFFLGSVGLSVTAHATMPVVSVRHPDAGSRSTAAPVVVGVDLKQSCGPLLDFAFETADRRGAVLRAAHAWSVRALYSYPSALPDPAVVIRAGDRVEAELDRALMPWRRRFPHVEVEAELAMGPGAPFLVESSKEAGLLVVGRRLRGHPFPTRIGPVTHAALHHAACPVAVVPYE
ncbi:universal stress protein [Streptomyces spirodelae]|uniref:Universal stress protein n=1 Tax=Streptomyces spirodelae TaxID=2812904 RepID=A0ABS3WMG3_9ACTN|nr:universal stress protein [Streptomyces spirodelae]MBO8184057.1 universal stress protein [Streptomyces spirodelae]